VAQNTGDTTAGIVSPKFSAVVGPFQKTEFYANFGTGFHSNDARGVLARGNAADALVRTVGGELGVRSQAISKLTVSAAYWWLRSDSELVYVGDAGTNEAGPKSQRHGLELNAYWSPCSFFSLDAEWSVTVARLLGSPDGGQIPNSVPWMLSGGFVLGAQNDQPGWFSGTRIRAFSSRPLNEDNSARSRPVCSVNANGCRERGAPRASCGTEDGAGPVHGPLVMRGGGIRGTGSKKSVVSRFAFPLRRGHFPFTLRAFPPL
jgi:hypothetical protein